MKALLFILISSLSAGAICQSYPYLNYLPMSNGNMIAVLEPIPPIVLPAKFTLTQGTGSNHEPNDVLSVADGVANSPHGANPMAPPPAASFDDYLDSPVNFLAMIVFIPTPSAPTPPAVNSAAATVSFQTSGKAYYDFISGTSGGSLSVTSTDNAGGATNSDAISATNPGTPSSYKTSSATKIVSVVQPVTDYQWSEFSFNYNGQVTTVYALYTEPTPNSPRIFGTLSGFTAVGGSDCGASAITTAILTKAEAQ